MSLLFRRIMVLISLSHTSHSLTRFFFFFSFVGCTVLICYIYAQFPLSLFCWLHVLFFCYLFVYLFSLVFFFFFLKKKEHPFISFFCRSCVVVLDCTYFSAGGEETIIISVSTPPLFSTRLYGLLVLVFYSVGYFVL